MSGGEKKLAKSDHGAMKAASAAPSLFSNDSTNYVSLYNTWSRELLFGNYLRGRGNLEGWGQDLKHSTTQLNGPRTRAYTGFC